jgi:hypothetical protein
MGSVIRIFFALWTLIFAICVVGAWRAGNPISLIVCFFFLMVSLIGVGVGEVIGKQTNRPKPPPPAPPRQSPITAELAPTYPATPPVLEENWEAALNEALDEAEMERMGG